MTRFRVVGGPWPERIGLEATIAEPTAKEAERYPYRGRGKSEVIIHIEDDPLNRMYGYPDYGWTCALDRKNLEEIK